MKSIEVLKYCFFCLLQYYSHAPTPPPLAFTLFFFVQQDVVQFRLGCA